jgi:hypothetical protein
LSRSVLSRALHLVAIQARSRNGANFQAMPFCPCRGSYG